MNDALRQLPSVDEVALRLGDMGAPRSLVIRLIRRAIAESRRRILGGEKPLNIDAEALRSLSLLRRPSLRRVINASGVVLHTNLGRAPFPDCEIPRGYTNLEYSLESGRRGKRDTHTAALVETILGEPGIVVNNNAAAVYLVLNELAGGHEVIVSRGQLIEIGDGFRIPDIMARAGAILREVGATNRTRIEDYRDAITERTRLLMIVHPSNFRVEGFAGQPSRDEIVALGKDRGIPVYEDLGSGLLVDLSAHGIDEPLAQDCLKAGVNLISISGDKLTGGPQSGIIAGNPALLDRIRRNPMFRAFRVDKFAIRALETTLRHIVFEEYDAVPAIRMIRLPAEAIRERAVALLESVPGLPARVEEGESVIGGGSTPQQTLRTWHIVIDAPSAADWERRLRSGDPPVITTIEKDRIRIDLRTVDPEEEPDLGDRLRSLLAGA